MIIQTKTYAEGTKYLKKLIQYSCHLLASTKRKYTILDISKTWKIKIIQGTNILKLNLKQRVYFTSIIIIHLTVTADHDRGNSMTQEKSQDLTIYQNL